MNVAIMKTSLLLCCLLLVATSNAHPIIKGPPPISDSAATARYVVNNANWGVLATVSTLETIKGQPFTNMVSISDGPLNSGTGIPYMYVTRFDQSIQDIQQNSNVSLTVTEEILGFCQKMNYDPEDPRCARITLTGAMVDVTGPERDFAEKVLFGRHPVMKYWPSSHVFYPVKIELNMVWVVDYFGGATQVPIHDYYNTKTTF